MTSGSYNGFRMLFSTAPKDKDVGYSISITCGQTKDHLGGAPDHVHIVVSPELGAPSFFRGLLE